jgi:hypothetical protein
MAPHAAAMERFPCSLLPRMATSSPRLASAPAQNLKLGDCHGSKRQNALGDVKADAPRAAEETVSSFG